MNESKEEFTFKKMHLNLKMRKRKSRKEAVIKDKQENHYQAFYPINPDYR